MRIAYESRNFKPDTLAVITAAAEHGEDSWELDALEPRVLRELVDEHVELHLDRALYDERCEEEQRARELLTEISDRWEEVEEEFGGGLS